MARRDLATELRGTHGWVLPAVMAALLVPSSAIPPRASIDIRPQTTWVIGAVPDEVLALPHVERRRRGALVFYTSDDVLIVAGPEVPEEIRGVLDGPEPDVAVEILPVGFV
ncbi:MAG TPA: hypothetical protein ENK18_12675, partial [Deltaproteobacteria bacterium]|nr:hypothetical protein [Deltaproteobacteria bacterium]